MTRLNTRDTERGNPALEVVNTQREGDREKEIEIERERERTHIRVH